MKEKYWSLGLMSGTSLDGIDAALLRTDGNHIHETGDAFTLPFEDDLRNQLREAVYMRGDIAKIEHEITLAHAQAVLFLLKRAGLKAKEVSVIGFHGQTIAHRPDEHITWQIGDGALLAAKTGIDVVCDFRRRDIAGGGQGAPLVPLFHAALVRNMELPVAILNIGGIANVTWVGRSEDTGDDIMALDIMAFDTGPGNVLMNEWALTHTGQAIDKDGKLALSGKADNAKITDYMSDPFFKLHPPKSLDRNYFSPSLLKGLNAEDGAATLTDFTAETILRAEKHFPAKAKHWYITGGGRHNPALMQAIKTRIKKISPVETLGWNGDALEAQAFAFLAQRSLKKLPLTLPTTTGCLGL